MNGISKHDLLAPSLGTSCEQMKIARQ